MSDSSSEKRSALVPLAVCVALGAVLRFARIDYQSFWYDECVSAKLALAPLADIVSGRAKDLGNPPLHLILLHVWGAVFGTSDASLRALSGTFGVASIPLLFLIGRRLVSERVGLVAAAILALSPLHVYFGQETRTYTIATFLTLASTATLLRAIESPSRRGTWALYALLTFLSVYAHYFCFFVIFAQLIFVAARHRREPLVPTRFGASLVAAAVLYGVWLPSFFAQVTTKGNLGRAAETWHLHFLSTPLVFSVGTTLVWKDTVSASRLAGALVAVACFGVPAIFGVLRLRREPGSLSLLLPWLLCPILIPLFVSIALFPFYYVRYALPASPAFYLLIAAGLDTMRRPLRLVAVGGMAVTSIASLALYFTTRVKHDWRDAAAYVESHQAKGDVVAFDADIGETSFARYAGADRERIRLLPPPLPRETPYWGTSSALEPSHDVGPRLSAAPRVWFVFSDPKSGAGDYYEDLFATGWTRVDRQRLRGIDITLLTPSAAPEPGGPAPSIRPSP